MKTESHIQQRVFGLLRRLTPPGGSLVDDVADILQLSNDSVYRRMRNETALTAGELELLSLHYDFSIDEFLESSAKRVYFQFQPIREKEFNFNDYLHYIKNMMKVVYEGRDRRMLYMANDIPLFHLLCSPHIAAFKLFFWRKTILDFSNFRTKKFKLNEIDEEINEVSRLIRSYYLAVPSKEIYSPETIDTTLKQVHYYFEAGLFETPETALVLLDSLTQLVEHLRMQCEAGHKFTPTRDGKNPAIPVNNGTEENYTVLFNEVLFTDATILVELDEQRWSYLTNNGLNVLSTKDERFYDDNLQSFNILARRSTLISGNSEKERSKVFNAYHQRIGHMRKNIEVALAMADTGR